MQAATGDRLIARLRRELVTPASAPPCEVTTERYLSETWLVRERAALFGAPRIVAASSQIGLGVGVPIDVAGAAAIVTRDRDGRLHAMANACRHRGTRLVDAPCSKAIVCPYHGWTYDLDGALRHVPHPEAFAGIDLARSLAPIDVAERHGLVWLGRDPGGHLGALDADLAALELADHVVWRTARVTRACNWKLVIEAFLDGYHLRVLHRDSIYRYFLDAATVAEPAGRHVRAITARRTLREQAAGELRALATPSFLIFPATIVIAHPDYVSIVTVDPLAPDRTDYHHSMLVPAARAGETEHWTRNWELIEVGVFQREDLWVCEQAQRGLAAGTVDRMLFGALEQAAGWFHASIDAALG